MLFGHRSLGKGEGIQRREMNSVRRISVTAGFSMRVFQKVFNEVRIAGTRSIRKREIRSTSSDYEILILAVEIGPMAWQALFRATPV